MRILITGGSGFIGSHTCVELLKQGHECVVVDNLSNSVRQVIDRIETITGRSVVFYQSDVLDSDKLEKIIEKERPQGCIHFAGLKAVGESVTKPIEYYHNNITGTLSLVSALNKYGIKNMIFSSSATVYGEPDTVPVSESCQRGVCTNPYGWTKWMQEQILTDLQNADKEWNIVLLRYFNPIGAHESGLIGEDPLGIPNNLMPYITGVAVGRLDKLGVFGNDYDTKDGTGVRDYIHVCDLAMGHVLSLKHFEDKGGINIYNLGTGVGYSVLDVVNTFSRVNSVDIPYEIKERRPGDIAELYSDSQKAKERLGFTAEHDLESMCRDSYRFQQKNPKGISD